MNILLVGDDPRMNGLAEIVSRNNHNTLYASDADKALFTFARSMPDLLIMPGSHEYTITLQRIREIDTEIECIFILDPANCEEMQTVFTTQGTSFVPAPVAEGALLSKMNYCGERLEMRAKLNNQQQLSDLILHGLPFPAMLISGKGKELVLANKKARSLHPEESGPNEIPFIHAIETEIADSIFDPDSSYRLHTLNGVKAYGQYWDISVEQVLPGIFLFTALDITQQRNQLQLREEMERIARHDLRSPTATIVGFANVLETESDLSEENRMTAGTIRKTAERMIRIIDTSLTLIRLENGSFSPDMHPFNIMNALNAAEADVSQTIQEKSLEIKWLLGNSPLPEGVPLVSYGEASMVVTMFSNLIKNAVEAAPGKTTVTVKLRDLGTMICTEIHNHGEVPEEIRNNFFDRYATSGKKHGTGLGTHSARLIARIMGGDITFTSSEEEGTTLKVLLPKPPQNQQDQ